MKIVGTLEDDDDARRRLVVLAVTAVLCYEVGFAAGIVTGVVLDKATESP